MGRRYVLKSRPGTVTETLDFDDALNDEQRAVVTAGTGPLLVIAGAGSGKTHTLTYRVAHLLASGVAPERILLLTFTNKAAQSMTQRVAAIVQGDTRRIWSGTFHSIGNRILRRYASLLAYPENYLIIDPEDVSILMKACVHDTGFDVMSKRFPRGSKLGKLFSHCINTASPVAEVLEKHAPEFLELEEPIREVFKAYQTRKIEMGVMDFDDLLLNWKRLLVEFEEVRTEIAAQFEYILVDEYQDTNHLQGELVDLMSGVHHNLMVVGDDCQSIYRFRGAEYRNILEFGDRHPSCKLFRLQTNYRSTPQILDLTNRSIRHNKTQYEKTLVASRPDGELPALVRVKDVHQQNDFVCQRVLELADEGVSLSEMAVLYRSHHHSNELQMALAAYGIPFVIRSGVRFFEQAHIKDVLAYLRFVYNPRDELSFLRIAQHFPGIGPSRAAQMYQEIGSATDPLAAASSDVLLKQLPDRAARGFEPATKLLRELRSNRLTDSADGLVRRIVEGPYEKTLESRFENPENRKEDLAQLVNYAAQYDNVDRFLGEVTLLSSMQGQDILVGGDVPDEHLVLSSVHQAKGLEWSHCFVLWLSDGFFPSTASLDDDAELEEERRLFYVATTRAKDELYLMHVFTSRRQDGRVTVLRESQFVQELKKEQQTAPWETWDLEYE